MNMDELKQEIEKRTGVPAALLSGSTGAEIISRAKSLIEYRKNYEPQSNRECFAEWFNDQVGAEDPSILEMDNLSLIHRELCGAYPVLHDGGEVFHQQNDQTLRYAGYSPPEQLEMFFRDLKPFNPHKENGWARIV